MREEYVPSGCRYESSSGVEKLPAKMLQVSIALAFTPGQLTELAARIGGQPRDQTA